MLVASQAKTPWTTCRAKVSGSLVRFRGSSLAGSSPGPEFGAAAPATSSLGGGVGGGARRARGGGEREAERWARTAEVRKEIRSRGIAPPTRIRRRRRRTAGVVG